MEKVFKSGLIRNRNLEQLKPRNGVGCRDYRRRFNRFCNCFDSVSRGFKTLLVNSGDFASGSSGSSIKTHHGRTVLLKRTQGVETAQRRFGRKKVSFGECSASG